MQIRIVKYFVLSSFLVCIFSMGSAQSLSMEELKLADSLFAMTRYEECLALYKKNFSEQEKNNESILLKLSFLSERGGNYADCLFYLSKLSLANPSRRLFEKMDKLADEHKLKGYEFDDYNYFIIFYRRYGDYIPILLLILGVYFVYIMVSKTRKGEAILRIHKITVFVFLIIVLMIVNIPSVYKTGVIINPDTFLRIKPSSSAEVVERVGKGHKIIVLGTVDSWSRVLWNKEIVYIRRQDLRNI